MSLGGSGVSIGGVGSLRVHHLQKTHLILQTSQPGFIWTEGAAVENIGGFCCWKARAAPLCYGNHNSQSSLPCFNRKDQFEML